MERGCLLFFGSYAKFLGTQQPLCKHLSIKLGFSHGNTEIKLSPIHWRLLGNPRKNIKIQAQPKTKRVAQNSPAQIVQNFKEVSDIFFIDRTPWEEYVRTF